jgi:hypothetical protein
MAHYVGLDVSVRHTSICIDRDGATPYVPAHRSRSGAPCHSGCSMRSHLLVFQ